MSESKITLKDGSVVKVTGGQEKSNASVSIYSGDYRDKNNHSAIHININTETGKGSIVEHGENHSDTTKTDTQCYLTTACMKHYSDKFDDDCYELRVLRWFRDNCVTPEDTEHYYRIAPIIIEAIEAEIKKDVIYDYIYDNIVEACVTAIENGDYTFAYDRYKSSILSLEEVFAKPLLSKRLVIALNSTVNF